jgi:carboxylesterase type B
MTGLLLPDNVVQFRAIPYATIPARFKHSVLLDSLSSNSPRDFTKHGYACPQTFGPESAGGGPFPDYVYPPPTDEFECLILQINVPLACLKEKWEKLPVLVYVHGGGFMLGKIDQQHNTALMVEQSILDSQPIIGASIQYRFGALGMLFTPEADRNPGLYDQRNALLWIQKFISGFGGNPEEVTVFGESAGSLSICSHMLAPPPSSGPLFKRAVFMSGIIGPMTCPTPKDEAEALYEEFLNALDINERGPASLEKLRSLPIQAVVDATAKLSDMGYFWAPTVDDEWFPKNITWDCSPELLADCPWVDEVVIGSTRFEGITLAGIFTGVAPAAFLDGITAQLGAKNAGKVAKAYNITPTMDPNLFYTQATRWVGDVIFEGSTHAFSEYLAKHSSKKVYRYVFDVRNPFPGHPAYQTPHHWVDKYFVFKVHQFRYPSQRLKDISTKHAQLWIDFTNGKEPWSPYTDTGDDQKIIMVADERDGWVERNVKADEEISELSNKRVEELWDSWSDQKGKRFLAMKIEPLMKRKFT